MRFKSFQAVIIVICILITIILPVYADQEKTSNEKADILNTLKIVLGDGKSYNLDLPLKRSEAAGYIVRLIGKDGYVTESKSKYSKTVFKDINPKEWYASYIGYCTEQGIICGVTKDTYKPEDYISEKAFLKITLCSLGYVYNKDFNMTNVYKFALDKGLLTDTAYSTKSTDNKNYKKQEVVNVLYNALNKKYVVSGITILQNLIDTGVITRANAVSVGMLKDEPVTVITQVTVNSPSSITVKLNENVKSISSSNVQIFETQNTSAKLAITSVNANNDSVTINTSNQTSEKAYTINIANIEDLDGNIVSNVTGSFTGYKNPEVVSNFFKIKKIEPVSKSVIDVYFTQPINMNAELPISYEILQGSDSYVKGSFDTMSIKVKGSVNNAVSIFLKNKTLSDGVQYTLKIDENLTGAYGLKLNDGNGDSTSFIAKGTENQDLYVQSVEPLYNATSISKSYIKVLFNKEVDSITAQQFLNYSVVDNSNIPIFVSGSVVTSDGSEKNRAVILTLQGTLSNNKSYTLTMSNVQDKFKQITIPSSSKYPFPGINTEKDALSVINVNADDKGTLTLFFNKPLSADTASDKNRYIIVGGISPNNVYFNQDEPYKVRLFFPAHNLSSPNTYTLRILPGFKDFLGINTTSNIDINFAGSSMEYFKPLMTEAIIVAKDAIRVRTNTEISTSNLNLVSSNYRLDYKDANNNIISKTPVSINYIDPTTLIIKFDSLDFSKIYTFKFLNSLTDYTGTAIRIPSDGLDSVSVVLGN